MMMRCMSVFALFAVALAAGTGCDSKIKELEAQNRSLSDRLETAEADNRRLQAEKSQLGTEIERQRLAVLEQDSALTAARNETAQVKAALAALNKDYQDLLNRPAAAGGMPQLPEELNVALKEFAAANPALAEYDEKAGMVKLKSDLTFASGSAEPKAAAADALKKLVAILNKPGAENFAVYVAGHTDDVPIVHSARRHPTNWYLSAHRAVGVQKVLQDAGLDGARIAVLGFSQYHPVAPNAPGNKGNAANRRVEIWIVPRGQFLSDTAQK